MIYNKINIINSEVTPYFALLRLTSPYFDFKILRQRFLLTSLFFRLYLIELQYINPSEVSEVSEVSKTRVKAGNIIFLMKKRVKSIFQYKISKI